MRFGLGMGVAAALTVTGLIKRYVGADRVERYASSNLDNLAARPIRSLLLSAVVMERGQWLPQTVGAAAALGALERQVGGRRAASVAAAGHILPTLATQAAAAIGVRAGRLPEATRRQIDTGASYLIAATVGALARQLPRQARRTAVGIAGAAAVVEIAMTREVVAAGHGLAFAVGYLGGESAPVTPRPRRVSPKTADATTKNSRPHTK